MNIEINLGQIDWGFIIALIVATIGVWFNISNRIDRKLMIFNEIVNNLFELTKIPKGKRDQEWDENLCNQLEYTCYFSNKQKSLRKHCDEMLHQVITSMFDHMCKKSWFKKYKENPGKYSEWKKAYNRIKLKKEKNHQAHKKWDFSNELIGDYFWTIGISLIVVGLTSIFSDAHGLLFSGIIILIIGAIMKGLKKRFEKKNKI